MAVTHMTTAVWQNGTSLTRIKRIVLRLGLVLTASVLLAVAAVGCSSSWADQVRKAEAAGDFSTATKLYEERLKQHPDDLQAIKGLAAIYFVAGRFNDALPYEEEAVARDTKDAQTRIELGFNYLSHQNQPAKAAQTMIEATKIEPSAKYLTFLAQAQMAVSDLKGAEDSLRKAIATDSSYRHAYEELASLLDRQGRTTEAAQLRQTAASAGATTQAAGT
jgi:tetratricopeptide (TPR) repeat protein